MNFIKEYMKNLKMRGGINMNKNIKIAPSILSADLIVTVKQLADQLRDYNVAEIRSYTNKKKIKEDVLDRIKELVK